VTGDWQHTSQLGLSAALASQIRPGVLVEAEVRYMRSFDGLGLDRFTGNALFVGPTFYARFSEKAWMSAAWSAQVAGRVHNEMGALDMINFWAMDTVPARFRGRKLHKHNDNVTLMRTTATECATIGRFIAEKLNRMEGPVRFLIPEGGVSLLDAPGKPFWDPEADRALFSTITTFFRSAANRKLIRVPHNVNDPEFAEAMVVAFDEVADVTTAGDRVRQP